MEVQISGLKKQTSDSWACASERAHKRRYEAVFEMHDCTTVHFQHQLHTFPRSGFRGEWAGGITMRYDMR